MGIEIRCDRCGMAITHQCSRTAKDALKRLFEFKLDDPYFEHMKKEPGYEPGDEKAPFFSESYLYALLGKENARTVFTVLNNFIESMGIDPNMSNWPKATCRHSLSEVVSPPKRPTSDMIKWCPDCGAMCQNYPSGEWETPKVKEKVGKLKREPQLPKQTSNGCPEIFSERQELLVTRERDRKRRKGK